MEKIKGQFFKPIKHRSGIWISVKEEMPELKEREDGHYGGPVLIRGKDNCIWLAYWDGLIWRNANSSDQIWFKKGYTVEWMKIPRRRRKKK